VIGRGCIIPSAVHRARAALLLAAVLASCAPAARAAAVPDCDGPPSNPAPGTPAWHQREQDNDYCGEQRAYDTEANPAFAMPSFQDPYRDPGKLNGVRFRSRAVSFTNRSGQEISAMLFRPLPGRYRAPYPGVVVVHGGAARQEMYLWGSEALAEAGYMVLTFQVPSEDNTGGDTHYDNTKDALNYFESGANPFAAELDRRHVGLAGHSAGGVAVSQLGQEDPRVSAIVSWDRAKSTPMPAGLRLRTPAFFLVADFNCQQVPVCVPQPYDSPPDPRGPGNKDEDFRRVSAAGVDSMKIALRAATHLDFTQFSPGTGSRYGAVVSSYYTLAWFDRYLKHRPGALDRLIARRFDSSADVHNISGGSWDGTNHPARIAGQPLVNRLSFHFRSAYYFGHGALRCEDVRAGCPARVTGSGLRCLPRRLAVSASRIGPARLGRGFAAFFRRYRAVRRRRGATRFCVRGGGRFLVGSRRGRIDFVATTARGHRTRRLGPGRRVSRIRGTRRVGRGLLAGRHGRRGRVVYGIRRRRVRFLAVVTRRQLRRPRALVRRVRRAGLR
jgi:dienelactone hydrolase